MAYTSFDEFKLARNRAGRRPLKSTGGRTNWATLYTGTTPTTAEACSDASSGAAFLPLPAVGAGKKLYLGAEVAMGQTTGSMILGNMAFADRLSHQGGLLMNTTAEQTTNLPTAALTRYTDGDGVMIGLDIHTSGNAACLASVKYTNQAGVSGRVTPQVSIPSNAAVGRRFILPLQEGDTGVRSVESVTHSSTAGSGVFGVTLFRMLRIPVTLPDLMGRSGEELAILFGAFPEVLPGACLEQLSLTSATSLSLSGTVFLIEG